MNGDNNIEKEKTPIDNALQAKCPSCSGTMQYSPESGTLKCIYCGHEQELDTTPVSLTGQSLDECAAQCASKLNEGINTTTVTEIKCQQCGATTTVAENITSARCAFCGSSLVLTDAHERRAWKPEYMLPFSIGKKAGREAYKEWLKGKWYAPNELRKNAADTKAFQGVYMPYWAYDAETETQYKGKQGQRATRVKRVNGKEETESYTEWRNVEGEVNVDFENLLVPASDTLPAGILNKLVRWDLENCVNYREEFLSGFETELYTKDFVQAAEIAKQKMDIEIDQEIKKDIGGSDQRIDWRDTDYGDIMFKHLLLPIWISSYTYQGKIYQFVVNGRTGEVEGNYPLSKIKVAISIIIAIIIAGILVYYMMK